MEQFVRRLRDLSGMSSSLLARRSGVSRSTQFRIDSAAIDPRIGTLRELALGAGFDIRLDVGRLSDPDAARAARVMLEPGYRETQGTTQGIESWIARLRRFAGEDPVEIVRSAGESASLLKRASSLYLAGDIDELKLVGAATYSQAPWVLSGSDALERIADRPRIPTGRA